MERVQKELDAFTEERQWIVTLARQGRITEEGLEYQLCALSIQELSSRRALADLKQSMELSNLDGWELQAREYLSDVSAGLSRLNVEPRTDEGKREQLKAKRRIVKALVDEVAIRKCEEGDRDLRVIFRLDIPALLERSTGSIKLAGTCSRKRSRRAPRPRASCA